jgi:TolB-like protein/Tfp pilus assembly protein PilF
MAVRNGDFIREKQIEFRIGIHLGDVMVQPDGDLLGDGVNVAARLEGIAEPGGICLSNAAYDQVRDKLKENFVDLGEKELKNIHRPVRVYRVDILPLASAESEAPSPMLGLSDKPSIAVLPFQNMSGDPEQEYFADGMVEDIITALSRFKELFVIARNSSFVYKGKAVDIQQVARELGVRYVLEGSVRKAGGRVRITGQLIDAATRAHLWADKFDGALADVFELQDRITESVVGALAPSLRKAEIERARRKPPANLDAYDYLLRALPHVIANAASEVAEATSLLEEALRLDPDYAYAHALLATAIGQLFREASGQRRQDLGESGLNHAHRAIVLGQDDAAALAHGGFMLLIIGQDVDGAHAALDKAVTLNPNSAIALTYRSLVLSMVGEAPTAIDDATKALRLSPLDSTGYLPYMGIGCARVDMGQYDEALPSFKKVIENNPRYPMSYAWAIVAECGRGDKAQAEFRLRQLCEIIPGFTAKGLPGLFSYFPPAFRDKALDLMRGQGLIPA